MCHSYVLKIRAFQVVQIGVTTRYIFKHIQRRLETAWLELPVFQPLQLRAASAEPRFQINVGAPRYRHDFLLGGSSSPLVFQVCLLFHHVQSAKQLCNKRKGLGTLCCLRFRHLKSPHVQPSIRWTALSPFTEISPSSPKPRPIIQSTMARGVRVELCLFQSQPVGPEDLSYVDGSGTFNAFERKDAKNTNSIRNINGD